MKPNSLLWVMLLGVMFSGCVRYYKVADVRESFKTGKTASKKFLDQARIDFQLRQKAFLERANAISEATPIQQSLQYLKQLLQEMEAELPKLDKLRQQFEKLVQGKRQIRSDSSQWEPFLGIKDSFEKVGKNLEKIAGHYKEKANGFEKELKKGMAY